MNMCPAVLDIDPDMPRRRLGTIRGWMIVTDEVVDCRDVRGKTVALRRPYVCDLGLYRAESPNENGLYRVFHTKRHAIDYIKKYLISEGYRVVPVRVDPRPLTRAERKAERAAGGAA